MNDTEMALGGNYAALRGAHNQALREIVDDRDRKYTDRFRIEAQAELRRREQAVTPADRAFAIAQGEAECREQAQHTPGRWQVGYSDMRVIAVGPEPCIIADCAADSAVTPERAAANAALIARAPELAAENERLRGLLAQCVESGASVLGVLTARFQNDYIAGGMTNEEALRTAQGITMIESFRSAIEAAKEASK